MTPKTCDSHPFQYKVAGVGICLDVCDPKGSRLERERAKYYCVGRCDVLPEDGTPVPKHVGATFIMNCDLCFVFYCA